MPTIIKRLDFVNPDSAGLPVISVPAEEQTIFDTATLTRWWRADCGWSPSRGEWRCRKSDLALSVWGSGQVVRSNHAAFNNKPILTLGGASELRNTAGVAMPTGSALSVVVVGRPGPNSSTYIWSADDKNSVAARTTDFLHSGSDADNGSGTFYSGGAGIAGGFTAKRYAQGPFIYNMSHDPVAAKMSSRVNRGTIADRFAISAEVGSAATANSLANLYLGQIGTNEEIAEVLIFSTALHLDTGLRGTVENYLAARYAIA